MRASLVVAIVALATRVAFAGEPAPPEAAPPPPEAAPPEAAPPELAPPPAFETDEEDAGPLLLRAPARTTR